ncbi:5' nucleotidase, NT5C type [Blautia sp.]|uniref:5' nucleotidase, NT5C type n=1 Tax=Blautia sp. TaxID=1955243 RepID=UPI0025B7D2E0|nr:hypothetical protein [Blautia sp.]
MLSQKKQRILDELSYEELFDAILCLEREQYVNAPIDVRRAIYQAWMDRDDIVGFLDYEVLNNIEYKLGIENKHWETSKDRLFVDMDGTLAEFKPCRTIETLYEKGYFSKLAPLENVVAAVQTHVEEQNFDVYILSAYLADSPYALQEKEEWLEEHLPEIDTKHRIFCPCGEDKSLYIPGGVSKRDYLLDDYTHNLLRWEKAGGKGIKLMNGINGKKGIWQGTRVYAEREPETLAVDIKKTMNQDKLKLQRDGQGLRR